MRADAEPDNVYIAWTGRRPICKKGTPIGRPVKLKDALTSFEAFDAESGARRPLGFQILDKAPHRGLESATLS